MNSYILDTNICIYIINQSPQNVLKKFHELDYRQISISIITYGELFYGISKGNNFAKSKIRGITYINTKTTTNTIK